MEKTGNPVFDWRTAYRKRTGLVQVFLGRLGTAVIGSAVVIVLWALCRSDRSLLPAAVPAAGLGFALLSAGWLWGTTRRKRLRRAFQQEFGLDSATEKQAPPPKT